MFLSKFSIPLSRRSFATKAKLLYPIGNAVSKARALGFGGVSQTRKRNFNQTFELSLVLGVDPRKQTEMVRGTANLPFGTGKTIRVAVFTKGAENIEKAKASGADFVGAEDLVELVSSGFLDFDRCLATPDAMPLVAKVGRKLGPRGLMPNPKFGTVTTDIVGAIQRAKAGEVQFRVYSHGDLHVGLGKESFTDDQLLENIRSFMVSLFNAKPEGFKRKFLLKAVVSLTMGKSVKVDVTTLDPGHQRFMLKDKTDEEEDDAEGAQPPHAEGGKKLAADASP